MAFDAHKNLAVSVIVTPPSPPASGLTLTVTAGEGARFPAPPFNATVWPASAMPDPLNAEIVRVTARAGDVLTIGARAQEGTTARTIVAGDLIANTPTVKTFTDIEAGAPLAGAWTPTLAGDGATSGQVYGSRQGQYVRVGSAVFAYCSLTLTNRGTTSGNLQLQGLPFAASGLIDLQSVMTTVHWKFSTPMYSVGGIVVAGQSAVFLRGKTAAGNGDTNMQATELLNDSFLAAGVFYLAVP